MTDSTALDDGSSPPPTPSPAGGGGSGWSLVPVDHDPFAAGSIANPQTSPSNNGLGAPNSQFQLSPLGNPGQSVSSNNAMQTLNLGQLTPGLDNDLTTLQLLPGTGANA